MYGTLVIIHSLLRWLVLILLVASVVVAWRGWLGRKPWAPAHRGLFAATLGTVDLQVLIGVLLWLTGRWWSGFSEMGESVVRFWTVEHAGLGLLALVAAHVGFARAKRAPEATPRYRAYGLGFTVALLLVLALIPWPFLSYGRALWPF